MDQSGAETMLECQRQGVEIHNAAVFAGGFLFGGHAWKFDEKDQEKLDRVQGWRTLCKEYDVEMGKLVMSFAFLPKVVTRMVVGIGSEKEVEDLVNNCSGDPVQILSNVHFLIFKILAINFFSANIFIFLQTVA